MYGFEVKKWLTLRLSFPKNVAEVDHFLSGEWIIFRAVRPQ
jgi:hypothetical protein